MFEFAQNLFHFGQNSGEQVSPWILMLAVALGARVILGRMPQP